jgi:hypothetical protein
MGQLSLGRKCHDVWPSLPSTSGQHPNSPVRNRERRGERIWRANTLSGVTNSFQQGGLAKAVIRKNVWQGVDADGLCPCQSGHAHRTLWHAHIQDRVGELCSAAVMGAVSGQCCDQSMMLPHSLE